MSDPTQEAGQDNTETVESVEVETQESTTEEASTEQPQEEVKTEETSEEVKEEQEQPKAPESYDLKMPEGVELDEKALEKFEPVLRELDLDNDQANKLATVFGEHMQATVEAHNQNITESWNETKSGWEESLKSDPDFGGNNYEKNVEIALQAVEQFGGDELKEAFEQTGMGSHPAMVKAFTAIGKAISEDDFNKSGERVTTPKSLYPNSDMNV